MFGGKNFKLFELANVFNVDDLIPKWIPWTPSSAHVATAIPSIFILFDDFNNFDLTYVWTYAVSIPSIYFLYFYFPKTKFYKDNFKIRKKSLKPINKSNN